MTFLYKTLKVSKFWNVNLFCFYSLAWMFFKISLGGQYICSMASKGLRASANEPADEYHLRWQSKRTAKSSVQRAPCSEQRTANNEQPVVVEVLRVTQFSFATISRLTLVNLFYTLVTAYLSLQIRLTYSIYLLKAVILIYLHLF